MIRFIRRMKTGAVRISDLGAAGTATLKKKARSSSAHLPRCVPASSRRSSRLLRPARGDQPFAGRDAADRQQSGKMSAAGRWPGLLLEYRRKFRVSRDRALHLVPKRRPRPVRGKFSEICRFCLRRAASSSRRSCALGRLPLELARRIQSGGQTAPMKELRQFLASTIDLQAEFLVQRLQQALPKMLAEGGAGQ